MIYGGQWEIISSLKFDGLKGKNETLIKPPTEKFVSPIKYCSRQMSPEKKIHYFPKPFGNGQKVYITTNNSDFGVITLRFQTSPCEELPSSDISLYMTLAWGSSYASQSMDEQERKTISKISPKLTNNIIYGYPKLTMWSRYNSIWNEGKVYSISSSYYTGPATLQIEYQNNSFIVKDRQFNAVMQDSRLFRSIISKGVQYLVVVDPFSLVKDLSVIGSV
uniref:Uncharacterized protein n=1 Tax=Panagrolaimus sp. ES5 TaxID=591445 RepID=A0AC34FSU1_9BILA